MSDIFNQLPLSQRKPEDESDVTSDWAAHIESTLRALRTVLESQTRPVDGLPALRAGYTVRDTVGHLVWRLRTPRMARLRAVGSLALRGTFPGAATLRLGRAAIEENTSLVDAVSDAAATVSTRRRPLADLAATVVDTWDVASAMDTPVTIDPIASGAVALARSLAAPVPIRSVVSARTLIAVDAGWRVGAGPALHGTASGIVLFLWGRAGIPEPIDPAEDSRNSLDES